MIETPHTVEVAEQHAAIVALVIPRSQILTAMPNGIDELHSVLRAQGIQIGGPWFTHHVRMDPEVFDFEICIPVQTPIVERGRARNRVFAAMTARRTVYHGPYEGLGAAWEAFDEWIVGRGEIPAPDLWERYLVGPEHASDSAAFRTELVRRASHDESSPLAVDRI